MWPAALVKLPANPHRMGVLSDYSELCSCYSEFDSEWFGHVTNDFPCSVIIPNLFRIIRHYYFFVFFSENFYIFEKSAKIIIANGRLCNFYTSVQLCLRSEFCLVPVQIQVLWNFVVCWAIVTYPSRYYTKICDLFGCIFAVILGFPGYIFCSFFSQCIFCIEFVNFLHVCFSLFVCSYYCSFDFLFFYIRSKSL